jgi:hypothetical protein
MNVHSFHFIVWMPARGCFFLLLNVNSCREGFSRMYSALNQSNCSILSNDDEEGFWVVTEKPSLLPVAAMLLFHLFQVSPDYLAGVRS